MIRALTGNDLVQVESIARESVTLGFAFVNRFCDAIRLKSVALDSEREFFLGVFENDALVAFGGITPDPYINDTRVGRVRHVYARTTEPGATHRRDCPQSKTIETMPFVKSK